MNFLLLSLIVTTLFVNMSSKTKVIKFIDIGLSLLEDNINQSHPLSTSKDCIQLYV